MTTDPRAEYDLLHLQWIGPRSLHYADAARRKGRRVVVSIHSLPSLLRGAFSFPGIIGPAYRTHLRRLVRHVDAVIVPSAPAQEELIPLVGSTPIHVVSSGVDLARFVRDPNRRREFRARYGLDRPTVLSVGQVIPLKGVEDFFRVAQALPEYQFLWAGPRPSRFFYFSPRFEATLRRRPRNVRFLGYIPEPEAAYNGSDVYFHPSHGESLGLAVLEAAAVGMPLVVRDLPVYRGWEGIQRGRDVPEFTAAIRAAIGEGTVADYPFVAEHSLAAVGKRLVEVYEEVLG